MQLSQENKKTFFSNLHKSIEESANTSASHIFHGRIKHLINYPPNGGLTEVEIKSLQSVQGDEILKSALRKVFASTTANVLFDMINVIDGTADPDFGTGEWSEVALVDKNDAVEENAEFLHDYFYESYWEWKEIRKNDSWSLDSIV